MSLGINAGYMYFVCSIVISSNQPTSLVDGWGPSRIEERSYDRGGEAFNGHAQRKTPYYQRGHYHNAGYHPWHDYLHRRHDGSFAEPHHYDNSGRTYFYHRNNRQGEGEDSEVLSRRTIDVGLAENGPQSLGGFGFKGPGGSNDGKGTIPNRGGTKPKHPRPPAPKRNHTQYVDFVFPDNPIFLPKSSSCGEGSTFCEKMGDDYPKEYITELLKKEGDRFKEVFGRDSILEMNITERVYKDETDLCSSSQRIIFPTKAKNKDEKWQFIINQEGYTQGIGVETCINAEKPCSMTDGFPLAYRTSCKQKYITRRLVSLNENGGPGMNEFLFPSCCVCILQSVGLGTRSKTRS